MLFFNISAFSFASCLVRLRLDLFLFSLPRPSPCLLLVFVLLTSLWDLIGTTRLINRELLLSFFLFLLLLFRVKQEFVLAVVFPANDSPSWNGKLAIVAGVVGENCRFLLVWVDLGSFLFRFLDLIHLIWFDCDKLCVVVRCGSLLVTCHRVNLLPLVNVSNCKLVDQSIRIEFHTPTPLEHTHYSSFAGCSNVLLCCWNLFWLSTWLVDIVLCVCSSQNKRAISSSCHSYCCRCLPTSQ